MLLFTVDEHTIPLFFYSYVKLINLLAQPLNL